MREGRCELPAGLVPGHMRRLSLSCRPFHLVIKEGLLPTISQRREIPDKDKCQSELPMRAFFFHPPPEFTGGDWRGQILIPSLYAQPGLWCLVDTFAHQGKGNSWPEKGGNNGCLPTCLGAPCRVPAVEGIGHTAGGVLEKTKPLWAQL